MTIYPARTPVTTPYGVGTLEYPAPSGEEVWVFVLAGNGRKGVSKKTDKWIPLADIILAKHAPIKISKIMDAIDGTVDLLPDFDKFLTPIGSALLSRGSHTVVVSLKEKVTSVSPTVRLDINKDRVTTSPNNIGALGSCIGPDVFINRLWIKESIVIPGGEHLAGLATEKIKIHHCEFIDPGFGDELWCKVNGCNHSKKRF